jgi:hypothetical protein
MHGGSAYYGHNRPGWLTRLLLEKGSRISAYRAGLVPQT